MNKKVFNPRSKTHWLNAITMAVSAAVIYAPGLESALDPKIFPWVIAGLGFANYLLRNVTNTAIDQK